MLISLKSAKSKFNKATSMFTQANQDIEDAKAILVTLEKKRIQEKNKLLQKIDSIDSELQDAAYDMKHYNLLQEKIKEFIPKS